MVELRHVTTQHAAPAGFLAGLSDSLLLEGPAGLHYYTVNGRGGGVLALDPENGLALLGQAAFPRATAGLDAPRQIIAGVWNEAPALIVAGHYDRSLHVFPLDAAAVPCRKSSPFVPLMMF